jgi:urease subunit beta
MIPGEYLFDGAPVELNAGRPTVSLSVNNTGDRPVQIGSHYHFFEVNRAMERMKLAGFGDQKQ